MTERVVAVTVAGIDVWVRGLPGLFSGKTLTEKNPTAWIRLLPVVPGMLMLTWIDVPW